ncbi:MAG: RNA-binding S4 domain-containing protein [Prevotella sp.]|uniref:pseudouridine synthase n=1 Tax=Prevotella sp. tf2-5 TaxID=1761889 RepID=UPI0008E7C5C4|nr:pseudouridine synthase [Prevotella sp. tf2-5]MBR2244417.1 RNA-binding S4 domain-containing protein [Prevotella sp.]MCR5710885.1 RNA-binding S4 domain-containing protein [Prevotella sp.]SFO58227.1 23S rRNA pseudouridine2605 synthase [Prevotella sp. tf2-5]
MELENENKTEEQYSEQNTTSREGFTNQTSGYQGYKPGRSPRPRIHQQVRPYNQGGYNRNQSQEEGGFRPEGFGASLQSSAPQRPQGEYGQPRGGYRPRFNPNNNGEGGYRPRTNSYQQGGYQPRQQGGYQPRGGSYQQGGYRPRFNQQAEGEEGGYQPRQQGGYQPRQQGGYQPRQQGGYQPRGGYGQPRGGYQQRGGYGQPRQQGGYNKQRGGYRQHTADYDPNAKYSFKKRIEYKEENYDPNEPIRLNKFLANAGVCSRREADEFIQAGVVTVNGQVVTELGTKVLRTDEVKFHDAPVTPEKKVYVLLNKPKDYVTTSDDPQQRKTVMELVKGACPERIYPVGRLDRNTTGVLLLTNDGDLASKLTHPKFLKKKIYHVYLDKNVTAHDMQQIAEGITLEDGDIKADDIQYADAVDKKQVGIEIHSGKNRIVRRIFESLGYKVTKLDRVQFAGLTKKNLRRGDWRYLTEEEVDRLRMGAYE